MSNSGVRIAVHSFAVCVHDVNKWMRARRLGLNPTKTQVMWLGSGQQLKHVGMLTSTTSRCCRPYTVQVVESARDLGVILHSRLTLSAHVAALCRSSWLLPAQTTTPWIPGAVLRRPVLVQSMASCKNRSCGVYFLPVGLLLFAALWAAGHSTAQAAVCVE